MANREKVYVLIPVEVEITDDENNESEEDVIESVSVGVIRMPTEDAVKRGLTTTGWFSSKEEAWEYLNEGV